MRETLNSNPIAQVAIVAVLLLATGFFVLSTMGGGDEEESGAPSEVTATVDGATATAPAPVTATVSPPPTPPPPRIVRAYESGATVAILFVHDGGIDDEVVKGAADRLAGFPGVTTFVVPAAKISRYAAITEGVGVDRVPALVVIRPKRVGDSVSTASVSYGFQSSQSVAQAVIDAGYEGPTVDYHP